ncbi:hypothetical protein LNO75_00375 [Mycoplasma sp. T363T]|uniref:hypothetical protein n=1 Tax=Mycoplasma bradburyae TaxID=2963128 RepID=UPI0023403AE9|nr:hypothetical protein [Mycoplasma bradburyae]MDC4163036.1 hypothetical protein [Mycoplasma bradburyae]
MRRRNFLTFLGLMGAGVTTSFAVTSCTKTLNNKEEIKEYVKCLNHKSFYIADERGNDIKREETPVILIMDENIKLKESIKLADDWNYGVVISKKDSKTGTIKFNITFAYTGSNLANSDLNDVLKNWPL